MIQRKLTQPAIGRPKPPLTKLKELPAPQRAKILEILRSYSYRVAGPMIARDVGFTCSIDALCKFFSWQAAQEDLDLSHDVLLQMLSFTRENYSDWPEEKARETAANFFTLHTVARRDVKGFASLARLHAQKERCRINAEKLALEKLKFEASSRRKIEAGLNAIAKSFKENPEALRLFQQAREMLEGGPTTHHGKS